MSKSFVKKLAIRIAVTAVIAFLIAFANLYWGTTALSSPLNVARARWQADATEANRLALDQVQFAQGRIRNGLLLRWTLQDFAILNIVWLLIDLSFWLERRGLSKRPPLTKGIQE